MTVPFRNSLPSQYRIVPEHDLPRLITMAPSTTTTTKSHRLRNLAILLLSSHVQALGHFQARDDLLGPPDGQYGWPGPGPGPGHRHGHGHDDGDADGDAGCSCPLPIVTSSPSGLKTELPVQTVTTTVTVPGPTVTGPGSTITVPGITVTIPGNFAPVTQPAPETVIITVPGGPNITVPASSPFADQGLNEGNLGPEITAPSVPTTCGPQTVYETVFTTVTSTIARGRYRQ